MKKRIISAWVTAGIATGLTTAAMGMVRLNSGGFALSIQGAVNAATNGDTLKIQAGAYPELVVISNKDLTLEGGYNGTFTVRDGGDTVVDAQQAGTTLWIMSSSSRVDRVHLRGGAGYPQNLWCGGGALLHGSWVEFADCRLYSNTAAFGGGLFVGLDAYAKLTGATEVYSNAAVWSGGGAFVDGRCDLVHSNTTVYGNVANEGNGGGIWVETGYLRLFQGWVRDNRALPGGSGVTAAGGGVGAAGSFVEMGDGATLWDNEAIVGGGLALFNSTGHLGRARIADCYLGANSAVSSGGGLYASNSVLLAQGLYCWGNEALQAGGGAWLNSCTITSDTNGLGADQCRTEGHGGGFYVENTTATVARCTAWMNEAGGHGGGLYATGSWIHATGMDFRYNTALQPVGPPAGGLGGGMALFASSMTITNGPESDPFGTPRFQSNQAGTNQGIGGAIYVGSGSDCLMYHAVFLTNRAFHGGALGLQDAVVGAAYTRFENNGADGGDGGAILADSASLGVLGGQFAHNTASNYGGAVYGNGSTIQFFVNTPLFYAADRGWPLVFRENEAREGGALWLRYCNSVVSHAALMANIAPAYASGIGLVGGQAHVAHTLITEGTQPAGWGGMPGAAIALAGPMTSMVLFCTLADNQGDGLRVYNAPSLSISNSILWGNQGGEIATNGMSGGTLSVRHCDVAGGWPGAGNIDTDPHFYPNHHLRHGSPCINAGGAVGPLFWPVDDTDVDGESRLSNTPDMGFDEFRDADGDRMPDVVETHTGAYMNETDMGTNPNDTDSDGDSVGDGDEWLADTDPTRGDEYLRIQSIAVSAVAPGGVDVHWVGGTQAAQVLEWADRPDGTWHGCAWYSAPTPKNNQGSFAIGNPTGLVFRVRAYRP